LVGVFVLEQRLDARRQAQVVTANLRSEVNGLSAIAFGSSGGLSRAEVQGQLNVAES
jgi:hypothetical protein